MQRWRCSWAVAKEAETLRPEDDEAALSSEDDDESDKEEDEDSSDEERDKYSSEDEEDEDSSEDGDQSDEGGEYNNVDEEDEESSEEDDDSDEGDEYNSDDEGDEDSSEDEEDEDSSEDDDDSDEEDDEYSTEEEESDGEVYGRAAMACSAGYGVMLHGRKFVPVGQFVGGPEPRSASAGSTTGFMRVAAVETQEGDDSDRQISVLYRCTHFLGAWGGGVRRLWTSLIAEVSVPTRALLLEVLVDFGILRTADRTEKRMERMRAALEGMLRKDFHPEHRLELQLPQPAQCGAGEDCAICWELLEGDDLAAWPGCCKPHVFHGACMELILKRDNKCPLCRSLWFIEPKPLYVGKEKQEIGDNQVDGRIARASSDVEVDAKIKQALAIFVRLYDNIRRFKMYL
nr:ATP-dependent RNA helicase DRS1-like [Lolium perenne]